MLSQTQVQFSRNKFELNEKSDHKSPDMMNHEQTKTQVEVNSSPIMLSQTQVQFSRINFELNEKSDHIPHDMMNNTTQLSTTQPGSAGFFFPREAMSLVLEYCDARCSAVEMQATWRGYQAWNDADKGRCEDCQKKRYLMYGRCDDCESYREACYQEALRMGYGRCDDSQESEEEEEEGLQGEEAYSFTNY